MSDVVAKCDNEKITKVKVASAEIIVSGKADKPYYEIKYYDLSKNEWCIGYGSYELKFVFQWLNECFELAKEPQIDIPVQCVDGSCPMALSDEYEECGMDVVHSCDECQYRHKEPQVVISNVEIVRTLEEIVQVIVNNIDCAECRKIHNMTQECPTGDCKSIWTDWLTKKEV